MLVLFIRIFRYTWWYRHSARFFLRMKLTILLQIITVKIEVIAQHMSYLTSDVIRRHGFEGADCQVFLFVNLVEYT